MANILFCLPSLIGGGAEKNTVLLANEMLSQGHRVVIAVDKREGPNLKLLSSDVKLVEIGSGKISSIVKLRKLISIFDPDVIYANIGISPIKAYLSSFFITKMRKIFVIYHSLYNKQGGLGTKLTYWLSSFFAAVSGSVIAVSEDVKKQLVEIFRVRNKSVISIGNPINLSQIQQMSGGALISELVSGQYIVSVGRLVPEKNYQVLLEAYALLVNQIELDLVIVGEGPLLSTLQEEIKRLKIISRVKLLGYLDNPFPVIKNSAMLVLASNREGFGNVLVEAMALSVPVVATNCPGGPKEILDNGKYGILAEVNDPASLAASILRTMNNKIDRNELEFRASNYDHRKISKEYLRIARI